MPFPDNHPIWELKKGNRAAKVREWVDLAINLETNLNEIKQELKLIRENMQSGGKLQQQKQDHVEPVDIDAFINSF